MSSPATLLDEPLLPPPTPQPCTCNGNVTSGGNNISTEEFHQVQPLLPSNERHPTEEEASIAPKCQDWFFALLFLVQLGTVLFLSISSIKYLWDQTQTWDFPPSDGPSSHDDHHNNSNDNDNDGDDDNFSNEINALIIWGLVWLAAIIGVALLVSVLALLILTSCAQVIIQTTLVVNCLLWWGALFGVLGQFKSPEGAAITAIMAIVVTFYTCGVWKRIPFAAAHLVTAAAAIRANIGILFVAYGNIFLSKIWILLWAIAVASVVVHNSDCTSDAAGNYDDDYHNENEDCSTHVNWVIIVLMLLSFFWTLQVLQCWLHTTVAGVVGTWWFAPQDSSTPTCFCCCCCCCCNKAISDSIFRSSTYSFGSICYGGLVVSVVQVCETLVRWHREVSARRNSSDILWCLLECFIRGIERLMKYFNKWAFVYVALYGDDYITAGSKVYSLFQSRGWTVIIQDNLIYRSLATLTLWMGVLTGLIGVLLYQTILVVPSNGDNVDDKTLVIALFFIGWIFGLVTTSIVCKLIMSGCDTVFTCFAQAPHALQAHREDLAMRLIGAWRDIYPNEFAAGGGTTSNAVQTNPPPPVV